MVNDLATRLQSALGDAYRLERERGGGMSRAVEGERIFRALRGKTLELVKLAGVDLESGDTRKLAALPPALTSRRWVPSRAAYD